MVNKLEKGQALIEIVFSISVVAAILGGLVIAVVYAQRATRMAQNRAEATQLAQQRIEYLRSLKKEDSNFIDDLADGNYSVTEQNLGVNNEFERETLVTNIHGSAPNRRAEIQVTVSWDDSGQTRDVSLNSYITEY